MMIFIEDLFKLIGSFLQEIFGIWIESLGTDLSRFLSGTAPTPTPVPIFIPVKVSVLAKDHPVKKMATRESIINWLSANQPVNLPYAMKDRFTLDEEWKVKYQPIDLSIYNLKELIKIGKHFDVKPLTKINSKSRWLEAIAFQEQEYLNQFLTWSDSLACSLKS